MTEALRAEWTKLRTLSTTGWLLLATVALTVAVGAGVIAATHVSSGAGQDPTKLALTGIDLGQAVIAAFASLITVAAVTAFTLVRATKSDVPSDELALLPVAA